MSVQRLVPWVLKIFLALNASAQRFTHLCLCLCAMSPPAWAWLFATVDEGCAELTKELSP